MLYAQSLAQLVKLMAPAGLALAGGKQAVGEFLAVVGEQLVDPDWAGLIQSVQKGFGTGVCLVGFVDHKQVAPLRFILHLGQVLHVRVQEKPGS